MIPWTLLESGGALSLVTVLICTTTTTAQPLTNLNATDGTTYNDSTFSVSNDNTLVSIAPNDTNRVTSVDEGILEKLAFYNSTGSDFVQQETTISDINVPNTEESNQSTFTASVSTFHGVYTTTVRFENTTPSISDVTTNQVPQFNTTLAIPSAVEEEEERLKKEVEILRLAVIVLSIVAGLGIICTIILLSCLILLKRKHKNLQTKSLMEISKQQRKIQDERWLEMTKMSSSDDIDSRSRDSRQETGLDRADTPSEWSEIEVVSDSNVGVKPSNPADTVYNNVNGTYANYNQNNECVDQRSQNNECVDQRSQNNECVDQRSQNNECVDQRSEHNVYGNRRSQGNEYVSEGSQNDEVYNNIDAGMNHEHVSSRGQDLNPGTRASSTDEEIYMNYRTGRAINKT